MARLKFHRDFTVPIDASSRRTFPMGWEGAVDDAKTAWAAVDDGAAAFVGDQPSRPGPRPEDVAIPAGWESLSAAELVGLALKLGAGKEVKTKDAAGEFVAQVAKSRSGQLV